MSYEVMGAVPRPRSRIVKTPPRATARTNMQRVKPFDRGARMVTHTRVRPGGRLPWPSGTGISEVATASGLGFSLKPPKKIRKAVAKVAKAVKKAVTLKNVLKVGAVVGAAALIPGALPAVAKLGVGVAKGAAGVARGAFGVARGVVGGTTRLLGKGVTAAARAALPATIGKNVSGGAGADPIVIPEAEIPITDVATVTATPLPASPVSAGVPDYSGGAAFPSASGGGGYYSPEPSPLDTDAAPAQAGGGSSMIPLAIGAVALVAVAAGMRGRRGRRGRR